MSSHEEACEWEWCDEPQLEDWFYCEHHSRLLSVMNRSLAITTGHHSINPEALSVR